MSRHYYPSRKSRILDARERGIRTPFGAGNPFSMRNSGSPLWTAYEIGQTVAHVPQFAFDAIEGTRGFPVVDLSVEFFDELTVLEFSLPAEWPRAQAVAA